jgi:chain length determinant protein EpsF
MTLHDLLLVLRSRWRIIVATTLLALFVVAAVNLVLPKQYRASATVVVDTKGGDPIAGNSTQSQAIPGYLATQVGIVSSDRVVQKVIQSSGIGNDERLRKRWRDEASGVDLSVLPPFIREWRESIEGIIRENSPLSLPSEETEAQEARDFDTFESWLTARLLRKLQVRPASEGNLIEITVTWEEGALAAKIANAFARAYIDTNLELKVEPAKQYVKWFEERNIALRKEVEKAQARLSEYQRAKGIVASSDASLDIENARLSELSSQLTALQGLRADSASRERQASNRSDSLTEVLQNPVVASLKADLSRLELKRAETAQRYGDNYPDIRRLDEQISTARERLDQEIARVTSSLRASNQINMQREAEIRRQLDAQRRNVLQMSRQRDEIAVLQSDVANAQRAYDTVTQRLAQTSLESQNQMTNVAIITPAIRPLFPDSPRVKVNLLLSLVFGFLFGVALALFRERIDQRLYGADHLRHVIGAPVFGILGQQGMALAQTRPRGLLSKW